MAPIGSIPPRLGGEQRMSPVSSWALAHFYEEEPHKGSAVYLCCRICVHEKDRPSSEDLESCKHPSKQYPGCIR